MTQEHEPTPLDSAFAGNASDSVIDFVLTEEQSELAHKIDSERERELRLDANQAMDRGDIEGYQHAVKELNELTSGDTYR